MVVCRYCSAFLFLLILSNVQVSTTSFSFLIIGGNGKIGTAVASHLLLKLPSDDQNSIILAGRDEQKCRDAVKEVMKEHPDLNIKNKVVSYKVLDWKDTASLKQAINDSMCDCIIHTAGPYLNERPTILKASIESSTVSVYIDVSDPLDFISESLDMNTAAQISNTSCLLSAGAFPGLSNVLAIEAANEIENQVKDVKFNYFTAGLGGSGDVNLYITNLGFGEPMVLYENGKLTSFNKLSGSLLEEPVYFHMNEEMEKRSSMIKGFGNDKARLKMKGKPKKVFAWPFPEGATVPKELQVTGDSFVAMGTAPDIWNDMLGLLVKLIPYEWWRNERFSKFLADFSNPLVKATDALLKISSDDNVGETHAMRIDVTSNLKEEAVSSVIQVHESFRRCVGQSCAEFAMDLLKYPSPGVSLPEKRYRDDKARSRIIPKLTSTPGTVAFVQTVNSNDK